MGVYKRGKTWWLCLRVNGKQIRQSCETDNKRLAEAILAKVKVQLIENTWFDLEQAQKAKAITFQEMTEKYLTKYHRIRDEHTVKRLLPASSKKRTALTNRPFCSRPACRPWSSKWSKVAAGRPSDTKRNVAGSSMPASGRSMICCH